MYIYGKNSVEEILKNKKKIQKCYLYNNFNDKNIITALQKQGIQINWITKMELDRLAKGNHQGIIVSVPDFSYSDLDDLLKLENPLLVLLDHIEDPHNFGAIIRTCEAAGVDGIIIPKDRSVAVNSTVAKVSVGALENIPICMVTNLSNTIKRLKKEGFWIVGTDMDGDDYTTIDYKGKTVLVIGNEGSGMARLIKDQCDFIASIPMYGKVNSLNASVAAGIMIYEAIKKR